MAPLGVWLADDGVFNLGEKTICLADDVTAAVGRVPDYDGDGRPDGDISPTIFIGTGSLTVDCAKQDAPCMMLDRVQVLGGTVFLYNLGFADLTAGVGITGLPSVLGAVRAHPCSPSV